MDEIKNRIIDFILIFMNYTKMDLEMFFLRKTVNFIKIYVNYIAILYL